MALQIDAQPLTNRLACAEVDDARRRCAIQVNKQNLISHVLQASNPKISLSLPERIF